jgi:hypothetical protein
VARAIPMLGAPSQGQLRTALRACGAIRYHLKNFRAQGRVLRDATIPPDNNIAEASLRRVALGRSNFLFVGNEDAGNNFAVLSRWSHLARSTA